MTFHRIYNRWSYHGDHRLLCTPSNEGPIYLFFFASRPCGQDALLLIKSGDVETNPGPTPSHKQVWICVICLKQIHGMKQISIRCNIPHSLPTGDVNAHPTLPHSYTDDRRTTNSRCHQQLGPHNAKHKHPNQSAKRHTTTNIITRHHHGV